MPFADGQQLTSPEEIDEALSEGLYVRMLTVTSQFCWYRRYEGEVQFRPFKQWMRSLFNDPGNAWVMDHAWTAHYNLPEGTPSPKVSPVAKQVTRFEFLDSDWIQEVHPVSDEKGFKVGDVLTQKQMKEARRQGWIVTPAWVVKGRLDPTR